MRIILLFLFVAFYLPILAQDKNPKLITDRPDQTESASIVPLRSLQIETGFVFSNKETELTKQRSFAYNTTLLRFGLLKNLELRLGIEYLGDEISIKNTDTVNKLSGLSPVYTGFKVKIAEEDGWKPEIAFLGALVFPFTASDDFKPENTSANIRLSFANTLSERASLGYNIGAQWDGNTAVPGYFYSIVMGVGLTEKIGMFAESFGLISEDGTSEHIVDAGLTYLVLSNFQLDISGGLGLNDNAIDNFISFGLSYRIPN